MFFSPEYREPKPPEWRPLGKMALYYKQSFKMQSFIFLKYRKKRSRSSIKKYLFIKEDDTYYKYSRIAKKIVNEAYWNQETK